jgi:hypothetical protein
VDKSKLRSGKDAKPIHLPRKATMPRVEIELEPGEQERLEIEPTSIERPPLRLKPYVWTTWLPIGATIDIDGCPGATLSVIAIDQRRRRVQMMVEYDRPMEYDRAAKRLRAR